jgi:hypothetical protein
LNARRGDQAVSSSDKSLLRLDLRKTFVEIRRSFRLGNDAEYSFNVAFLQHECELSRDVEPGSRGDAFCVDLRRVDG